MISCPQTLLSRPRGFSLPLCIHAKHIHLLSLLVISASVAVSLAYVWLWCPLDLASDEAHYWDWSRHLDWCYYSKGPLVAWLIRGSCEIFGSASIAVTGNLGAAVRMPAILCHGALLFGSYVLATGLLRSQWAGLIVVAVEASLPVVRAGSVLMTIDPPFLACWCWALVCIAKVVNAEDERLKFGWWFGAAALTALGILAKYTMTLFPIAVLSFFLVFKRAEFRRPGVWILLSGAILGWAPIVAWNSRYDWVSFRHVVGQVGGEQAIRAEIHWFGPLMFLGVQFGILFGGWLIAFLAAGWRFSPHLENDAGIRLIWWCSVPVWFLFALANFIKIGQPNWPAPAYIGGIILAVAWLREQWHARFSQPIRIGLIGTIGASLFVVFVTHSPGTIRPVLAKLVREPSAAKPLPVRELDLSARLVGWKMLAREIDQVRVRLTSSTGEDPVLAGTNWTLPGHLGFYCSGQPQAYGLGIPNGTDRHSQYDFWHPNPVNDAQAFRNRTFVIVGDIGPEVRNGFEWIEPGLQVVHAEDGIPIAAWTIWVCHGFRGFAAAGTNGHIPGY